MKAIKIIDDEFKFDYYVLLNRSFSDDKQDKALGMNAEYIEIQVKNIFNFTD